MVTRERQLKQWRRDWKFKLIIQQNPNWDDLYPQVLSGAGIQCSAGYKMPRKHISLKQIKIIHKCMTGGVHNLGPRQARLAQV